jgi:arabinose-5-phosphate isomerase
MTDFNDIQTARRVMRIESDAIASLADRLDENFSRAVELLMACSGKVIVTGMGKSGHIGGKIASTFASTGTSAFYMHPGEGMHGDLGVMSKNDVIIAISTSGNSSELIGLLPTLKKIGAPLIAMTGNSRSKLAKFADVVLDIAVTEEACPLGLAPTASTTSSLVLGDALAVALLERKGFSADDFALLHPGGSLGKRLLLQVGHIMHAGDDTPRVNRDTFVADAVVEMSQKRMGITGVFDIKGKLLGCVTDGDLRRGMQRFDDFFQRKVEEIMSESPKIISADTMAVDALRLMEKSRISVVFIHDPQDKNLIVGAVHMHDILSAGLE